MQLTNKIDDTTKAIIERIFELYLQEQSYQTLTEKKKQYVYVNEADI